MLAEDPIILLALKDAGVNIGDKAEVERALTELADARMLKLLYEASNRRRLAASASDDKGCGLEAV